MIQLENCDNMELMKRYPDNYFDLAIVDPPYGLESNLKKGKRKLINTETKKNGIINTNKRIF
jgi:site-specific DNA-methyltransferase (adenine-specific)